MAQLAKGDTASAGYGRRSVVKGFHLISRVMLMLSMVLRPSYSTRSKYMVVRHKGDGIEKSS